MKIYFCDGCNESIPLADLESGLALTHGGKIYCGQDACAQSKLVRMQTMGARSASSPALSWVAAGVAVVAFAAGGFAVWHSIGVADDVSGLPDHGEQLAGIQTQLEDLASGLDAVGRSTERYAAALSEREAEQSRLIEGLDTHGRRLGDNEAALREVRTLLDVLRSDREKLQTLELSRQQFERSLSQVRESMGEIEGRLAIIGTGAGKREDPVADSADPTDPPIPDFDEETRALIADLDSRDASVRWSSVDRLASLRDPSVVPFLAPLLEDPDAFVQFRVIGTLRELGARQSVGPLIALLRDGDAIVREEALEALVSLTGNPARFEVANGSAADREDGVRVWENWYRENRDRFDSADG